MLALLGALMLSACGKSEPSSEQIQSYVENYQIVHGLKVGSMTYDVKPQADKQAGTIQVSGKLELVEPLYVEDEGNRIFRKNVAEALRRNGFSEQEINHTIYNRVVQASTRVPGDEIEYYTFLKIEHKPGFEINFSANLKYRVGGDGYILEGTVRHPQLLGSRVENFSNPALDDDGLVQKTVENVLAEQARYRELMKQNRALLTKLWDNDYGMLIWNRKTPYLGNENLSIEEQIQLTEFRKWRAVYHFTNIKPVQYRTPHASNFFELGAYTTDGIATCLRQTGFTEQLIFLKSKFNQYCEFGKQYPVRINLSSTLDDTNNFVAKVTFEINGVSSGELSYKSTEFSLERNELGRYSDKQRLSMLEQPFDINHHSRPIFTAIDTSLREQLYLKYTGASDYIAAGLFDQSEVGVTVNADGESLLAETTVIPSAANTGPGPKVLLSNGTLGSNVDRVQDAKAQAETELVKAIQTELKRLGIYESRIDGIAGAYTYWSMTQVRQQLGKNNVKRLSVEFLTLLRNTPDGSVEPPTEPYRPPTSIADNSSGTSVDANEEFEEITIEPRQETQKNKGTGTLAGNALRWFGKQFAPKKKEESVEEEE